MGVEPARAMAEIAQSRELEVCQGQAEALPFAGASFDFVLMVTVLCFLQNPIPALREATRVLKPHGVLILGLIDPDSRVGRSYEAHKEKSKFYRQAQFHPVRQVLDWLEDLGYLNPRICQTIFQDLPAATWEPVREGFGAGAFVAIRTQKPAP